LRNELSSAKKSLGCILHLARMHRNQGFAGMVPPKIYLVIHSR